MRALNLRRSDGSVALLASRVPDLGFDGLSVHLGDNNVHGRVFGGNQEVDNYLMIDKTNLDGPSGKLDPDGGFRLQVELVPCEAGQQVGLAHTGVADQDNW